MFPLLGYSVSVACLIWVYHGFDWERELPKLVSIRWHWVTLAICADIAVYICQGLRWSVLLSPLAKVRAWKSIQAIYIGLFANEVLPFRSGEVIRCYLLSRWTGIRVPVVITSAAIERMLDGFWLVLGLWIAGRYVQLPRYLTVGGKVLLFVLLIASVLMLLAVLHKPAAREAAARSRWSSFLVSLVDGVHLMGGATSFLGAAVLSLGYLALQVLPIYFLIRGYGMDLSPWAATVVLIVLRLGTVIPQAPGNVGSFQALTIVGLRLFGVDRGDATGFATVLFLVITMPLWMAGFVALLATKMRLNQIHRAAEATVQAEE
ncbi:MAG: lysylphosphatidylglycerol synthase transmembrane domain-containing protein [Bryobacteraceae bacterium]